jgi:hypothetical protein
LRLDEKPRIGRKHQTYANCPLPTPEDRLLFILVYLKTNNLQVIQGELFGMPQNKTNQWIHTLLPVLQATLRTLGDVPARSMEELAQRLGRSMVLDLSPPTPEVSTVSLPTSSPAVEQEKHERVSPPPFCHDGTERRIQRPKDQNEQKSHDSGKKKCHTVKNVLLVDKQLKIQFLSQTHPGTVHDKRIADATPYPLPQGSSLLQDLGFLGFTLDGVLIEMPIKKPKKRALTDEQKRANRARARRRVAIEHVNSSVKRCRTLKDVCRLFISGIRDLVIEIGCALHNFRLRLDPWLPIPESE